MAQETLMLSICLPRRLEEIKDEIIWRAVQVFGTQKLAALNLAVSEATISRRLNHRRGQRQGRAKS
jgi:DNA-binding transcriptional regulator YdaS (Cro superfamily)